VRALAALAPPLAAAAVRALGATLRLHEEGVEALEPRWAAGQPLIYAVWHGRILMIPWLTARMRRTRGARAVCVLASRSRDGEMVARWVTRFGLSVVRGSSSRGGAAALRALAASVRAGEDVAVVPDGPRGPRERLQAGLVVLAAATGAPIVPLGFAARPARRLAAKRRGPPTGRTRSSRPSGTTRTSDSSAWPGDWRSAARRCETPPPGGA